jgi:peptidoglycan/LPS O-acetylase OafA/YrhL
MNSNNQRLLFGNTFSLGLLYVLLPLALAGGIYIAFRSSPPLLLSAMIELLPYNAHPFKLGSNFDWLVYNVPDGLWSFSFTSFLLIACRNDRPATRKLYSASGSILMVNIEVAQGIYLPGTYDHLDVVATIAGAGLSYLMLYRSAHQQLGSSDDLGGRNA